MQPSPQELIETAERWLHDFYTRLSNHPHTLHFLYLEGAEAVYTGKNLSSDASLMSGRQEISTFFSSPVATRFYGSRINVEAVHPIGSPTLPYGINVFVKGEVFLPLGTGQFQSSSFVHFLCLSPIQRYNNQPPMYLLANEFFHVLDLSLEQDELHSPIDSQVTDVTSSATKIQHGYGRIGQISQAVMAHLRPQVDDETLVSHPPHLTAPSAAAKKHFTPGPRQPESTDAPRESQQEDSIRSERPLNRVQRNDNLTLHACPTKRKGCEQILSFTVEELCAGINAAIKELGLDVKCTSISRPTTSHEGPKFFFFVHLDSAEGLQALKNLGIIVVRGSEVKLSSMRTRKDFRGPNRRDAGENRAVNTNALGRTSSTFERKKFDRGAKRVQDIIIGSTDSKFG